MPLLTPGRKPKQPDNARGATGRYRPYFLYLRDNWPAKSHSTHAHAFLMAQHDAIAPLLDSSRAERDLVAFPVFTLINLAVGRTSVLPNWKLSMLDRLPPAQLESWLQTQQITRALIPPSLCEKLVQSDDTGPLRHGVHRRWPGVSETWSRH